MISYSFSFGLSLSVFGHVAIVSWSKSVLNWSIVGRLTILWPFFAGLGHVATVSWSRSVMYWSIVGRLTI